MTGANINNRNENRKADSTEALRGLVSGGLLGAWTTALTVCVLDNLIDGVASSLLPDSRNRIDRARGQEHLGYFDEVAEEFFTRMTRFVDPQNKTAHQIGIHVVVSDFVLLCDRLHHSVSNNPALRDARLALWDRLTLSYADRIEAFLGEYQNLCLKKGNDQTDLYVVAGAEKLTSIRDTMQARSNVLFHGATVNTELSGLRVA